LPFMLDAGNFLGSVADLFYQARLAFYMGHLERAELICQQWKQKFAEIAAISGMDSSQSAPEIPAARGLDVVRSMLLLERGQIEEAENLLVKSLELLGWGSWMELHGFIELARLRQAFGNERGAQEVLLRMHRLGPQHAACAQALENLFAVKKSADDPETRARAEAWTQAFSPDPDFPFALGIGPYHRDAEYFCNLVWARVQVALGYDQEAAVFLGPALQTARERGLLFREAELSIVQALRYDSQGKNTEAMQELERALEISETCGYTRFFDDSPVLDQLLQQAVERNIHAAYASQLLASFTSRRVAPQAASAGEKSSRGLVDPLSERELEVLRFLATSQSSKEIAQKLFLSPFTLKAHTQNIYTKLDVHSRIEAVNKARELGLL
jgi:LuxR family maltose regulon positive regulatory protein